MSLQQKTLQLKTVKRRDSVRLAKPEAAPRRVPEFELDDEEMVHVTDPLLGLPLYIVEACVGMNISRLYKWQAECLLIPSVMSGTKNLVYAAPTSAGKSLVADLLMIHKCVSLGVKAILVLPFVSIVREKTDYLQRFLAPLGLKVGGYYSSSRSLPFEKVNVAVCTFEKATSLINRLIDADIEKMACLGMVIVDELHMVGDPSRGYLIEPLLTKIRYIFQSKIQIIGMSATLPNISDLAQWLDAELYVTRFRPIELFEYLKLGDKIYDKSFALVRTLDSAAILGDEDKITVLIKETVAEGNSVLVFCSTKLSCQKVSEMTARIMAVSGDEEHMNGRMLMLNALRATPEGLDPSLKLTILKGISYHHAGLNNEERTIVEDGFKAGFIKVLMATSTLASGVNLPARRVIFRTPVSLSPI